MKTEYEVRVLEIDKDKMIANLESLGAVREGEYFQRRYTYDLKPKKSNEWIRLRTNGTKTTLAYKKWNGNTIDGTKELEIEVSDFEDMHSMLGILGYRNKGFQENKRIRYILDNVEIDIDTWPMIPAYVEIEGTSEQEVWDMIDKLVIDRKKVTSLDVEGIYEHYGFSIEQTRHLRFEEE